MITLPFHLRGGPELRSDVLVLADFSVLPRVRSSTVVADYCLASEGRSPVTSPAAHVPVGGTEISGFLHWLVTTVAQRARAAVSFLVREPNVMAEIRLAGSYKPYTLGDSERTVF